MDQFLPFFVVLFAGIFFSGLFKTFHLPWAITLIIGGFIIGPEGFGFFQVDETINFIGQIGLVFLMFMAGLESHLSDYTGSKKKLFSIAFINGFIPFLVGFTIGVSLGFSNSVSALIGIIFISSSVAIILPTLESTGLIYSNLGRTIIGSVVVQDIASLIFLSILLQNLNPIATLPLPLFYIVLLVIIIILRWAIPKIKWIFTITTDEQERVFFQRELRAIFTILIGTVLIFEFLGLHPVVAGFFAGLVLANSIKSEILFEKIRTISYGLFIPTFFVVVGAELDISVFSESNGVILMAVIIVLGSVISKFGSGYIAAKISGFTNQESKMLASSSIPQLSTSLAVAFTGFELGLFGQPLLTSMIILSIATTFLGPIMMRSFYSK